MPARTPTPSSSTLRPKARPSTCATAWSRPEQTRSFTTTPTRPRPPPPPDRQRLRSRPLRPPLRIHKRSLIDGVTGARLSVRLFSFAGAAAGRAVLLLLCHGHIL